jgi:hypothetical protein
MKKFTSKIIGKDFYIDEVETHPVDGLPCFNEAEIYLIQTHKDKITKEFLTALFDFKVTFGGSISEILEVEKPLAVLPPEDPMSDIGYKTDPEARKQEKLSAQAIRANEARVNVQKLSEIIANAKIKTQKENKSEPV